MAEGLVLMVCWWPWGSVDAANWYVDRDAVGSNKGTNWDNAWTSPASVVWGASGVKAGDTLYFNGGSTNKTYTNSWTVGASGTSNKPIRITVDAADASRNGKVIFDYAYAGDQADITAIKCVQDYVIFDGNVNGECHLVINNLRNIMDESETAGIYADSTSGVVVDHLASTNCNNPIRFIYATGFTVRNCNLRQVRGDAAVLAAGCTGSWDANLIYSNHFEMLFNTNVPPGATSPYYGPDGIQCGDGASIFANTFHETKTTNVFTSKQHPDLIQVAGQKTKIYGNEFINVGDAAVDYDLYDTAVLEGLWIYNNVFRIEQKIDSFPEYIRIYNGSPAALMDIKILNNTFIDNNTWRTISFSRWGNPIATDNEIKNNIFYNCGGGTDVPAIYIEANCEFTRDSFVFDGNIFYAPSNRTYVDFGATYLASTWVSAFEPHGKTNAPGFLAYSPFGAGDNLHLSSNDKAAVNAGVDLSDSFSIDKDGVARPQGAAWDIGAYEYGSGGAAPTNLAPVVSVISQNIPDADPNAPGLQILTNSVATYSGSASDPNGDNLAWQWIYSVNGGPEVVYQSGVGAVVGASFSYGAGTAGNTFVWKLRVTDGPASSETQLKADVVTAPRGVTNLTAEAEAGVLGPPFMVGDGAIYQEIETGITNGGRAAFTFTVPKEGEYMIRARVDAHFIRERSFYVNVDAEPQNEEMTWTVPLTVGFTDRIVSWQGAGDCLHPQFSPKVFHLTSGLHQLNVRGREANARLDQISLVLILPEIKPEGASDVQDTRALLVGQVNPFGIPTYAYFEYGRGTNYDSTTPIISVGTNGELRDVSAMVSGLAPRTVYSCRVVAYNANGTNYGADRTFTTTYPILRAPAFQAGQFAVTLATAINWVYYFQSGANIVDTNWTTVTNVLGDGQMQVLKDPHATSPAKFYRVVAFPLPIANPAPATTATDDSVMLNGSVDPIGIQAAAFFEFGVTTNYGSSSPAINVGYNQGLTMISNMVTRLVPQTLYNYRLVAYNAFGTNRTVNQALATLRFRIHSFAFEKGAFSVLISTVTGRTYYLEYITNLNQPNWITVSTVPGDGLSHSLIDTSTHEPQRFYRVRVETP